MYFIINRRHILWSIIFFITGIAIWVVLHFSPFSNTFISNDTPVVIIDAGHGLPDGGAVGVNGTVEQQINLSVSQKIQEILSAKGFHVIMTRNDENGLFTATDGIRDMKRKDMAKRLEIMKNSNADLFISIHMNYFTAPSVNGLRIFYSANHSEIKPLAERIQSKMSEITGAKTTAVKTADKNLFLMKNPPLPAILIECGFLSNPIEEKKLNDDDYRSRLAWAISDAIENYYIE